MNTADRQNNNGLEKAEAPVATRADCRRRVGKGRMAVIAALAIVAVARY